MRAHWILVFGCLGFAGCAAHRVAATDRPERAAPIGPPRLATDPFTRVVATPYAVRTYRDPDDPTVVHAAHTVYRLTRVPTADADAAAVELPRSTVEPANYAPLPASAELKAELSTQHQITIALRRIEATMAATEKRARAQYGTLVSDTTESIRLRTELENERRRVRELEAKLQQQQADAASVAANSGAQPNG